MNIFILDQEPKQAAQAHCDKHIAKMILESAQMLSTALGQGYKATHKNHPCTLWTARSLANALWLYDLTHELDTEYRYRFNHDKQHKSYTMLKDANVRGLLHYYLEDLPLTTPAQAMPDYLKSDDAVFSYRMYYKLEKQHLLKYTRREMPQWLEPCSARVV